MVGGDHDLAPAARADLVGGVFFFGESDHQFLRLDQPAVPVQVRLDPQVAAVSRPGSDRQPWR